MSTAFPGGEASDPRPDGELRPGRRFAGHRIEGTAGRGGMGVVYRATNLALERVVALKVISPLPAGDPGFAERFRREARLLAALDHPNVIPVYEAGESEGRLYLTMRWVDGTDLATLLGTGGGLEVGHVLAIGGQVAAALDAAHGRGLVHGDVKPANVLLEGDHAFLSDFGAGRGGATGEWLGPVDYVAPELVEGAEPGPAADVYSLGCVLYESLTGRPPYLRGNDVDTLWAHRHAPPPSLRDLRPELSEGLDAVVARALEKDPAQRWASAGELVRATRAATRARPERGSETGPSGAATGPRAESGPPGPATAPPAGDGPATTGRRRGRRPLVIAGLVVLLLVLIVVMAALRAAG